MSKLILIKHSLPLIDPNAPAAEWELSVEGVRRCARLADALTAYLPAVLVSSPKPKAHATAANLAERLNLSVTTVAGLGEQHRRTAPFLTDAAFCAAMQTFFALPDELVFGEETADAAYTCFAAALESLLEHYPQDNLLVVAHGTVISLYVSRRTHGEAFALWRQLGLPSFIVLDRVSGAVETSLLQIV
ncbi:MAG: phosphoglycerate mutase family protein [Chloroflexales bacterium]|nr:phosphoglycerate mutase family protein [Chloroflexales bacterium]